MHSRRDLLKIGALGVAAAAAGGALSIFLSKGSNPAGPFESVQFSDLSGNLRRIDEWNARLLLVNFWATWCPPCLEEIPALVAARRKVSSSGIEFIGIAIDSVPKITEFAAKFGITYPVLVGGSQTLGLLRSLGNPTGGLPFTIIRNDRRQIGYRHVGALTQPQIEEQLRSMLVR
jgi:thiol-disulfide isomerase/thioredoxin